MKCLCRFIEAQEGVYEQALYEIRTGKKTGHWMWYIFPQFSGLGFSDTSKYYSITDIHEAKSYLNHPILGVRLRNISKELLLLSENNAFNIFGTPDDLKLKSCMTLFATIDTTEEEVFLKVLDKFYLGVPDNQTVRLIKD